jgi:5-methylcytosine-specific restriction endonuclease McrA
MNIKKCKCCGTEFSAKDSRRIYCSSSCAAKINGKLFPKRKMTKKCKECGKLIASCYTYCPDCIQSNKHLKSKKLLRDMTIEEFENRSEWRGSNRYSHIRYDSRKTAESIPNACKVCGYSKHVEVCHVKPISSFPKTTLIKDVNEIENLIKLCPNCHWEFDNNILKLWATRG